MLNVKIGTFLVPIHAQYLLMLGVNRHQKSD
nr:MAG TPA: hypothetical protein [Caudoviricetes sp.]